jgi:hypothetical protein
MKQIKILIFIVSSVTVIFQPAKGQNTFSDVYSILQSNCSTSGCHGGASPISFSVDGSEADVYDAIVGVNVSNTAAMAKGNKLVAPGDVYRSFLLRKIAHGISQGLNLDPAEKDIIPGTHPQLSNMDFELLRQWVLFGAAETGITVDTGIINDYYRNGGIEATYSGQINVPDSSEGFQMYIGKIFIPPMIEYEYFVKYDTKLSENKEVYKVETFLPSQSHHFIAYKFFSGQGGNIGSGLRTVDANSHGLAEFGFTVGPNKWEYELPQGTAYFWAKNLVLDINLHIQNPSADSIMACDIYMNVYTQSQGTADHYMFSNNYPNYDIAIPHDSSEYTFEVIANDPNATNKWKIWKMTTHTHRYGTDYDVWIRNPDGSKGTQVYEGFFNYEDNFSVGFYRWGSDVTIRTYEDPYLEVNPHDGFIHRAKFINTAGPDTVKWGLTSLDEMMVLNLQYFAGAPITTGIEKPSSKSEIILYPNPANGTFELKHHSVKSGVSLVEVYNSVGERVSVPHEGFWHEGTNIVRINTDGNLTTGIYFVKISFDGESTMRKIIITL